MGRPSPTADDVGSPLTWNAGPAARLLVVVVTALALGAAALAPSAASAQESSSADPADPATWPDDRLAAQLVNACVPTTALDRAVPLARRGIGGIALLGRDVPADVGAKIAAVRSAGIGGVPPLVAADEEGGTVQRLGEVLGALPSAEHMGSWSRSRIRATARAYGEQMRDLGVAMALSPVADLAVPGRYIAELGRAFSDDPTQVSSAVIAWSSGMLAADVVPVLKHWPGHGAAADSHVTAARIPPFDELQEADLVPFDAGLEAGVPAVMVGHLVSEGLTEPDTPATLSPRALAELRARAGDDVVVMTDSLAMAAATSQVGLSPEEAAVRSLAAGVDWALTCAPDADATIDAVREAIGDGTIDRDAAVAKARRILALKARVGQVSRMHACREPLSAASPPPAGTPLALPAPLRIAGPTRYETAAATAARVWPDGSAVAYVATGEVFADALAATPAAAVDAAPVLLVGSDAVPEATRSQLTRLRPDRIVVVGGPAAVSPGVVDDLEQIAPVERVAGSDRVTTASALSARGAPDGADAAWLAVSDDFADGLAAGPRAAADDAPLLLVHHDRLPTATAAELRRLAPEVVTVVGGQAAVCESVAEAVAEITGAEVRRVAGTDRTATAALLARSGTTAWLATGRAFPDALTAGAAAARSDGSVVLVPTEGDAGSAVRGALSVIAPQQLRVVGGPSAVAQDVVDSLAGDQGG